ncbi:MAG: Zeta toxin [Proteobacteria bacterium]|nr:Zeta toxin [Pseudomonadota bacterium]NOG61409.1 Zeta toxin [Pseudomonadota bacterium]
MELSSEDKKIEEDALAFARANKKAIAEKLTDTSRFIPEDEPVSVFMAGSPGAGKTEASIELLARVEEEGVEILRIDPDDLRQEFPGYLGGNSWLFQNGVSVLVEKIHDLALKKNQSFLLDGTLSHYEKAKQNISRSLKKGRVVQILYVYQEPKLAWEFVTSREIVEGRRIRPEHFIEQYFAARNVVNLLKVEFGSKLKVDLLMKNTDNSHKFYKAGVDKIDNHIPEKYTPADLELMLGLN